MQYKERACIRAANSGTGSNPTTCKLGYAGIVTRLLPSVKKEKRRYIELNSEETVSCAAAPAKVVDISDFGIRMQAQIDKRQKRLWTVDDKFAALNEDRQIYVLCHMIGYIEASNDLIASGKRARSNEISKIFEVMENIINESWNGGMI